MAIESNESSVQDNTPRQAAFTGATLNEGGAPSGSRDFLSLYSNAMIAPVDAEIEPYLTKVSEAVKNANMNVELVRMDRVSNAYAYVYVDQKGVYNFFVIQFVMSSDQVSANLLPFSVKYRMAKEEITARYSDKNIRIVDMRVILSSYKPDMDRHFEMAGTIVREFSAATNPALTEATIQSLVGTEFSVSWNILEARKLERLLSPHGVAPRMEVAMVINAKIHNEMATGPLREFDGDYRPFGVIGGYVEFRDREEFYINNVRTVRYRPVFNITVCNSTIPIAGSAAILLAAFAPTIYKTKIWLNQWNDLSASKPNPGVLEIDPATNRPFELKNKEELLEFANAFFAPEPVVAFQLQDGRDVIPGMRQIANGGPDLVGRLCHFFGVPMENISAPISSGIETRFDGVFGEANGQLTDSRVIDFLQIAAATGIASIDPQMRRVLMSFTGDERDRARLVKQMTGETFIPVSVTEIVAINPQFIDWIIQKSEQNQRLTIVDPTSHMESRPLGQALGGFGSANNMGSIVSHGITARGLGIQSAWY